MWGLFLIVTVTILTLPFVGCSGRQVACIELSGRNPEKVLASLPVKPGIAISLEFINSIYRAPVKETLAYDPRNGLAIVMVESPSAGVFEYYGLEPDGTGQASLNRNVGDIRILSHDYANHRVKIGKTVISLKGLVPDGEPVVLKLRRNGGCGEKSAPGGD